MSDEIRCVCVFWFFPLFRTNCKLDLVGVQCLLPRRMTYRVISRVASCFWRASAITRPRPRSRTDDRFCCNLTLLPNESYATSNPTNYLIYNNNTLLTFIQQRRFNTRTALEHNGFPETIALTWYFRNI